MKRSLFVAVVLIFLCVNASAAKTKYMYESFVAEAEGKTTECTSRFKTIREKPGRYSWVAYSIQEVDYTFNELMSWASDGDYDAATSRFHAAKYNNDTEFRIDSYCLIEYYQKHQMKKTVNIQKCLFVQ